MNSFFKKVLLLTVVITVIVVCILHTNHVYAASKSSQKVRVKKICISTRISSHNIKQYKVVSINSGSPSGSADADSIVSYAKKYLGARYKYGASGPNGFDCSGFTMHIMSRFGIYLPHSARSQSVYGTIISRVGLKPGDLVYFATSRGKSITHVGIYMGSGYFIHAASKGVVISSLNEAYYNKRYVTATRVIK